ncbi:hypothetical protein BJ546DRAFT_947859 [Cryomyces antarcticus]
MALPFMRTTQFHEYPTCGVIGEHQTPRDLLDRRCCITLCFETALPGFTGLYSQRFYTSPIEDRHEARVPVIINQVPPPFQELLRRPNITSHSPHRQTPLSEISYSTASAHHHQRSYLDCSPFDVFIATMQRLPCPRFEHQALQTCLQCRRSSRLLYSSGLAYHLIAQTGSGTRKRHSSTAPLARLQLWNHKEWRNEPGTATIKAPWIQVSRT